MSVNKSQPAHLLKWVRIFTPYEKPLPEDVSKAYDEGKYRFSCPPVTTAGWDKHAWCNWVAFDVDAVRIESHNIYPALKEAGCELSNHCSDLYVKVTEESKRIVSRYEHPNSIEIFRSDIDGELWYDIPFAYLPAWEKKAKA